MADEIEFEWDEANRKHITRHAVSPEEVEQVLRNDPFDLTYEVIGGEQRWAVIGHTDHLRVLVVVWALRGEDRVRVITARTAGRAARDVYLREKGF